MEEYIIFSARRANQLIRRGCNFLRTAKDAKILNLIFISLKILPPLEKFMMR